MQSFEKYQSSTHANLLNNRYEKVRKLGEGSYGTVFLARDTMPKATSRKVDNKYLNLLDKLSEDDTASKHDYYDRELTEDQKSTLSILGNRTLLFPDNDVFQQQQQ